MNKANQLLLYIKTEYSNSVTMTKLPKIIMDKSRRNQSDTTTTEVPKFVYEHLELAYLTDTLSYCH